MKNATRIILIASLSLLLLIYLYIFHQYLPTRLEITNIEFPDYMDSDLNYVSDNTTFFPGDYFYILAEIKNLEPKDDKISFTADILTKLDDVVISSLTGELETITTKPQYLGGYYPYATRIALPYNLDEGEYDLRFKVNDNNKGQASYLAKRFNIIRGLNMAKLSFCSGYTESMDCIEENGLFFEGENMNLFFEASGFSKNLVDNSYAYSLSVDYSIFDESNNLVEEKEYLVLESQDKEKIISIKVPLQIKLMLDAGTYRLQLRLTDEIGKTSVTDETYFEVI